VFVITVLVGVQAGAAFAAFTPSFSAVTDAASRTTLAYSQAAADAPAANLTFFVPFQYLANFGYLSGQQAGTVTASVIASDLGNTPIPMTGTVNAAVAADTVNVTGTPQTISSLAQACAGAGGQVAFFVLNLSGSGLTLQIPVFVDAVQGNSPFSTVAGNLFQICPAASDVPAGTAGRAPSGAKIISTSIVLDGVFSPPLGWYLWHLRATPYVAGTTKRDTASVELVSQDRTPPELTVAGRTDKKTKRVIVTGQTKLGGKGVSGAVVTVRAGTKVLAKVTSGPGGRYRVSVKPGVTTVSATAAFGKRTIACAGAILAPLPCLGGTVGATTASAAPARVKK
jgi:hypothetical protein